MHIYMVLHTFNIVKMAQLIFALLLLLLYCSLTWLLASDAQYGEWSPQRNALVH